jgi:hypothetical protein
MSFNIRFLPPEMSSKHYSTDKEDGGRTDHGTYVTVADWQGLPIDPDASAAKDEEQKNSNDFGCWSLLAKCGSHAGIKKNRHAAPRLSEQRSGPDLWISSFRLSSVFCT